MKTKYLTSMDFVLIRIMSDKPNKGDYQILENYIRSNSDPVIKSYSLSNWNRRFTCVPFVMLNSLFDKVVEISDSNSQVVSLEQQVVLLIINHILHQANELMVFSSKTENISHLYEAYAELSGLKECANKIDSRIQKAWPSAIYNYGACRSNIRELVIVLNDALSVVDDMILDMNKTTSFKPNRA